MYIWFFPYGLFAEYKKVGILRHMVFRRAPHLKGTYNQKRTILEWASALAVIDAGQDTHIPQNVPDSSLLLTDDTGREQ